MAPQAILEKLRGLSTPRQDHGAEDEQRVAAARDAVPIRDVTPRSRVRVCGVVRAITYPAPGRGGSFKATLWDGTGTIDVVWLGRKSVDGMSPGIHLIAEGVAAKRGDTLCIHNPAYEVIAG